MTVLSRRLSYLLPVLLLSFGSAIYEWVEWAAALVFGGGLGVAYVGSQGDPWDAQKNMLLANTDAVLTMLLAFRLGRYQPINRR